MTPKTARRLWNAGRPGTGWGDRPLREVVLDEHRASTARANELARGPEAEEVAEGRRVAIETRAEEARLNKYARANVQGLLNATTQITATALKLAQRIDATLSDPEASEKLTLQGALLTLSRMAGIIQKGVYAAESVVGLERMTLGDPGERAGLGLGEDGDMPLDDALEEIQHAAKTAARLERQGLRIIRGGKDIPLVPEPPAKPKAPAAPVHEGEGETERDEPPPPEHED